MMENNNNIAFEFGERYTWVVINCQDRSGLLLDIIHTLVHFNLTIHSAVVETMQDGSVRDRFAVRKKEDGSIITHREDLEPLRVSLEKVIGEKPIRVFWKQTVGIFQVFHIVCPERSHLLGDLVSLLENEQLLVKACEIVSLDNSDIWICFCDQNNQLVMDQERIKRLIDDMVGVIEDPSKVGLFYRKRKVTKSSYSNNNYFDEYASRILVDNTSGPFTTVAVNTDDRFGLLYDLVLAISRSGYSIISANITTREDIGQPENVKAYDVFEICDPNGEKICEDTFEEVSQLRQSLMDACTHPALIDRRDNHIVVELCYSQQMKCIHGITQGLRNMGLAVHRAMIRSERISFVHDKLYIRKDSVADWDIEERKDIETRVTETILSKLLDVSIYEVEEIFRKGTIVYEV